MALSLSPIWTVLNTGIGIWRVTQTRNLQETIILLVVCAKHLKFNLRISYVEDGAEKKDFLNTRFACSISYVSFTTPVTMMLVKGQVK